MSSEYWSDVRRLQFNHGHRTTTHRCKGCGRPIWSEQAIALGWSASCLKRALQEGRVTLQDGVVIERSTES